MSTDRLLVNGRFLLTATTGLQRVARDLLLAARAAGLDFTTIAPGRPDVDAGLAVDAVAPAPPGRAGALLWEQLVLPAAARGRTVLSPVNLAPLAGRNVVIVHDLAPRRGPEWFSRSGRFYGRVVEAAARRAKAVLTVSDDVRGQLVQLGVDESRLAVVRPAVTPSLRPATPEAVERVRAEQGLGRDYVLFVGWSDPRKDVMTAVAASARVAVPHDLVLVGRPHPAFMPVPPPRGANVRTLGYVTDEDLSALLTGARALLYPTLYEGFGLPPLEAAVCGTPAIVSDLPVLHESGGGSSTYVPAQDVGAWADAIEAALRGQLPTPEPPAWTWAQAADQLIAALRRSAVT